MRWRKTTTLKRLCGRFRRKQDGVTAVEFALVGGPFLWLVCTIFETSAMLFTDIAIENGVVETARLIRTGQVQTQGIGQAQFKQILCGNIASYLDCAGKMHVEVKSYATLPEEESPGEIPEEGAAFSPGAQMQWVVVRVRYDWEYMVPQVIGLISDTATAGGVRRIRSGAIFRNEPYGG